jgi:membrane-bound ClpP family serine protease
MTWIVAAFVLGFSLLAVEVLLVPGLGVPGLVGAGVLAAATWALWHMYGAMVGGMALVASVAGVLTLVWWLQRSRAGKGMVLAAQLGAPDHPPEAGVELGAAGVVIFPLRPSGTVEVGGMRLTASAADGRFTPAGVAVRVVGTSGASVIVERSDSCLPAE